MDIDKYNKIRSMYKPSGECSPLHEVKRTTLDANSWSDPTTNIKKPTAKPITTGFDSFFEGVTGLGKRINEAGGWKSYFQGKKDKKDALAAGVTVEELNDPNYVGPGHEERAVDKYEGTLEDDEVVEKTDEEIEAYKNENASENADGEVDETSIVDEVKN